MATRKNGNRRFGAGAVRRAPSSAESGSISTAIDVDKVIRGTCRGFARAADWRHDSHFSPRGGDNGAEGLVAGYRLSEDHEGLHTGRYIIVSVLRAANAVAIKGGYYDGYWQPRTVYRESVALKEVTSQTLGCLLAEMHDRLCSDGRPQGT
jgi:hypothetical protein